MSTAKSRRWKYVEDTVCRLAGLERLGHMARGLDEPDGKNDAFTVEITSTQSGLRLLSLITNKMSQAIRHNEGARTPIVVVVPNDREIKDGFVVYRFSDWRELYTNGGKKNGN